MTQDINKIDWTDKCWNEMLIYQRKSAIHTSNRDQIAQFYGLHHGMKVVDVGCGLGFLGYNYWQYYGKGGHYTGIDLSSELINQAKQQASKWAQGGDAEFIIGDAYKIPLEQNFADCVMCQTLLMHLSDPAKALKEMIRIAKPGGVIICQEPDNISALLRTNLGSLPDDDIEDILLKTKVVTLINRGRIKLGLGDAAIGPRVFALMNEAGLSKVDLRTSDYVPHLYPPYEDEQEQVQLDFVHKQSLNDERRAVLKKREKEAFLAGGGVLSEWEKYCKYSDRVISELRHQIDTKTYFYCGVYPMYFTRGYKPVE